MPDFSISNSTLPSFNALQNRIQANNQLSSPQNTIQDSFTGNSGNQLSVIEQLQALIQQSETQATSANTQLTLANRQAQQALLLVQRLEQEEAARRSALSRSSTPGTTDAAARQTLAQFGNRVQLIRNDGGNFTPELQAMLTRIDTVDISADQKIQLRNALIASASEVVVQRELLNGTETNIRLRTEDLNVARNAWFQGGVVRSLQVQLRELDSEHTRRVANNNTRARELELALSTGLPALIQQAQREEQGRQQQAQQRIQAAQAASAAAQQLAAEAQQRAQATQQLVLQAQQAVEAEQAQIALRAEQARQAQLVQEEARVAEAALQEAQAQVQAQQTLNRPLTNLSLEEPVSLTSVPVSFGANVHTQLIINPLASEPYSMQNSLIRIFNFFLGRDFDSRQQEGSEATLSQSSGPTPAQRQQQQQAQQRVQEAQERVRIAQQRVQAIQQQTHLAEQQAQVRVQQLTQQLNQQARGLSAQGGQLRLQSQTHLALSVQQAPSIQPILSLGPTAALTSIQVSFAANVHTERTISICNNTITVLRGTQRVLAVAGGLTNLARGGSFTEGCEGIDTLSALVESGAGRLYGTEDGVRDADQRLIRHGTRLVTARLPAPIRSIAGTAADQLSSGEPLDLTNAAATTVINLAGDRLGNRVTRVLGGNNTATSTFRREVVQFTVGAGQNTLQTLAEQVVRNDEVDVGGASLDGLISSGASRIGNRANQGTQRMLAGRHYEASATSLTRTIARGTERVAEQGVTYAANQLIPGAGSTNN